MVFIKNRRIIKPVNVISCLVVLLFIFMVSITPGVQKAHADNSKGAKQIPPLDETVSIVLKHNSATSPNSSKSKGKRSNESVSDIISKTKKYYYELQLKNEQLKVANEVKEYFEKASSKAEEKYEEGDTSVTQSSLTKLKLGLSGTLNDIISLTSEIHVAKLSLGDMMGWQISTDDEIADDKIVPLAFKFENFEEYFKSFNKSVQPYKSRVEQDLALRSACIKVTETRDKLKLADKQKKMTRALLVTESSNYDFGIGNPDDLFQALIIYTRVLSGYYESIYNFNVAVVELDRTKEQILASL